MGWMFCGEDSRGRPIGYGVEATCDAEGCNKVIDRGLGYVCGDMHGSDEYSCEGYFCEDHRNMVIETHQGNCVCICDGCYAIIKRDAPELIEGLQKSA